MHYFHTNIEKATLENTDYRRVLYTTHGLQLVLMHLEPGVEIGMETHGLDQFLRIESGSGTALLEGKEQALKDDDVLIIPRGTAHNIINTGSTPLKLYSVYGPAEHKDGIVQHTKADEAEEHFDGKVSY
ncbi:cupin domain-containing protein [Candidatus Gracilibacteria bacterium CG17_big_fil_post_rev_8_21_14_2_50_48_13]|nr:MAG: cupin domain-containing protein [Candidatus Gracilibacteria bacterium CG17_big_fil_post_rev_8_21_14_2_50_48_13]